MVGYNQQPEESMSQRASLTCRPYISAALVSYLERREFVPRLSSLVDRTPSPLVDRYIVLASSIAIMGFPLVCYCLAVPKPLVTFCRLLCAITDAVLLMIAVLGLRRFPPDGVAATDAPLPEDVKRRLPAMQYGQLLAEQQQPPIISAHAPCDGEATSTCIVCLERLEATDEVRRLGGCAHAFHRGCIDRWIDLGRATCPLCRCSLLPRARGGPIGLARLSTFLNWSVR